MDSGTDSAEELFDRAGLVEAEPGQVGVGVGVAEVFDRVAVRVQQGGVRPGGCACGRSTGRKYQHHPDGRRE